MKKLATLFTRSLQEFKQVKTVTVCAMLGAVALVLGSLSVEIIPSVRIGFSGIPNEFVAWLFGPVVGPLFNGTMDILKYLAKPTNAYFPGLTMVTMLAGCIYGCFFYGRPMRLWRVLVAKFTVALICNVILNTFCLSILLGKGFWLLLPPRILRNVIMWPIDSLIFFYLAKFMETAGVLRQFGLKPALEKGPKTGGKR
ncbi:folate family ECF transporter S component [Clostridium sp. AF18-27]|uniref:ECF transporter S component, folate family n=1 Tax=Enterocloster lavalensis TaxID=460384 RepID=A0A1I0EHV3_9FIRM|nr:MULTISPECIES: folate family ECF transporter S component [Enterocloster]MDR3755748.1 folate family ECF transporter S component [Enterocloster sp.]PST34738.1 folate family ECF transporter S component [Enterocloster lavalensis]RHR50009.1 folate family ECF transporter S component [Clostridium sp. AF18-27]SET44860.1 ECF transporter S component, folate family [Enterocloster lavalensis]